MSKENCNKGTPTHHSLIQLSNGYVRKVIEPEYRFSTHEQEALMSDMLEFRRRLHVAGVPVASKYNLAIKDGVIVEETANCGVDGFRMLQVDAASKAERVLRLIVQALRPILSEAEITLVPDPHPANWCFDGNGVGRYIDFQPARFQRDDGLKVVGFPQPTGREYKWSVGRYYSKAGLIRILRFNAMRGGGSLLRGLLTSIMRKELPTRLFEEIGAALDDLLEERVRRNELSVMEALELCDEWNVDDIRELAMIVAERKKVGQATFLNNVLECTRVDFNIPIADRRRGVERAKLLISAEL